MDFFTNVEALKQKGIKKDLVILKATPLLTDTNVLVYIIPAQAEFLEYIELHIKSGMHEQMGMAQAISEEREYHVIVIPKMNNECNTFLSKSEYREYFKIHNLNIDIYTLDHDLMSLEDPNALRDIFVNENYNSLSVLSRAIVKFETVFGKIKHKYVKGNNSKILKDILAKEEQNCPFDSDSEVLACVMIDRDVDFITPFCSQFTYEGLLDEQFGINLNAIRVKPSILEKDSKLETMKLDLSNRDKFYSYIKDFNFNKIRIFLPERLRQESEVLQKGKNTTDMVSISKSLEKIKSIKEERPSLNNHINLADYINQQQRPPIYRVYLQSEFTLLFGELPNNLHDIYENEMGKKADMLTLLKLICLESLTQSGIKSKIYDSIKKDFLLVYGFQEVFLFKNLEKMKILRKSDRAYDHSYMNKKLNLCYEQINVQEPNDPSYVFGGYCPITVRMIENLITKGWGQIKDIIKYLPGEIEYPSNESEIINPKEVNNIILLVFVGGITYAEIAAIRYLNKNFPRHKFVILTTGIVHGKRILESLRMEKPKEEVITMKSYYTQLKELLK